MRVVKNFTITLHRAEPRVRPRVPFAVIRPVSDSLLILFYDEKQYLSGTSLERGDDPGDSRYSHVKKGELDDTQDDDEWDRRRTMVDEI